MGGVDLMDRLLSSYLPRIKSKNWWWSLFINAIDIAVVTAWKVHCKVQHSSLIINGHLDFRCEIVTGLLKGSLCNRLEGLWVLFLLVFALTVWNITWNQQHRKDVQKVKKILRNSV